jgi:glycosyltransferase involved in cell wall biosynthesis
MERKGLVSIIVPVYNLAPYIGRCLGSILGQTYPNWEALVIVDPSDDGTEKVVAEMALDPRFRVVVNKKKGGVSLARNQGLALSQGEYVSFLDGDDFWEPEFLEKAVSALSTGQSDLFYSGYSLEGRAVHHRKIYTAGEIFNGDVLLPFLLGKVRIANCGAMLIKKRMLDTYDLGFEEGCSHSEDAEFRLKIFAVSSAVGTDQALFHLVTRENSLSRTFYFDEFADKVAAYSRAIDFIRTKRDDRDKVEWVVERWSMPMGAAEYLYKAGQTGDGLRALMHLRHQNLSRYLFQLRPRRLRDLAFFFFLVMAGLLPPLRRVVV